MRPVGSREVAVTASSTRPMTIDAAVAPSFSKENRKGAAMGSSATTYSFDTVDEEGLGLLVARRLLPSGP